MIGYYVHHVGRGHLHRARALEDSLSARGVEVTGLSSLGRPNGWLGHWLQLPRDDEGEGVLPTARGRLHWAPLRHDGLRARMAAVSAWVDRTNPDVMVADVSVEILLMARLLGVPTVAVVQPGHRGDAAHLLGYDVADALVAFWPAAAHGMLRGVPQDVIERVRTIGALSRFPPGNRPGLTEDGLRQGLVLLGAGGHVLSGGDVDRLRTSTPGWAWTVLDGTSAALEADVFAALTRADVIVTHAGQNALAETAAARRAAIVIPQERPHAEQSTTASVLSDGHWPVIALDEWPSTGWLGLLDRALGLDSNRWAQWCDGLAAERFADVVDEFEEHAS